MKILQSKHNRQLGFTLLELMIVIAIIAILAAILFPSFTMSRAQANLTACKSNVKNLGTACEMYAIEHDSRYPSELAVVTNGNMGGYMKVIPTCPACGADTYTASYAVATNPDAFTVRCGGANHTIVNVPEGYPLYSNILGLSCNGEAGEYVAVASGGSSSGSSTSSASSSGGSSSSDSTSSASSSGSSSSSSDSSSSSSSSSATSTTTSSSPKTGWVIEAEAQNLVANLNLPTNVAVSVTPEMMGDTGLGGLIVEEGDGLGDDPFGLLDSLGDGGLDTNLDELGGDWWNI